MSNTTPNTQNDYAGGLTPAEQGIAAARAQVASLTTELDALQLRYEQALVREARNLTNAYAERDNAVDAAAALRNRYYAARKVLARRRAERREMAAVVIKAADFLSDMAENFDFLEYLRVDALDAMAKECYAALCAPAPVAAQPAPCRTCSGTGSVTEPAQVQMDSFGVFYNTTNLVEKPCPNCAAGQECDLCCGEGYYVKTICGELEELDCPACDGTGARRGTKLYQERAAKRAADLEAARNAPIPF